MPENLAIRLRFALSVIAEYLSTILGEVKERYQYNILVVKFVKMQ